jgi:hypothetical protein
VHPRASAAGKQVFDMTKQLPLPDEIESEIAHAPIKRKAGLSRKSNLPPVV